MTPHIRPKFISSIFKCTPSFLPLSTIQWNKTCFTSQPYVALQIVLLFTLQLIKKVKKKIKLINFKKNCCYFSPGEMCIWWHDPHQKRVTPSHDYFCICVLYRTAAASCSHMHLCLCDSLNRSKRLNPVTLRCEVTSPSAAPPPHAGGRKEKLELRSASSGTMWQVSVGV